MLCERQISQCRGIALGWRAANESVWLESQTHDRGMVYSAEFKLAAENHPLSHLW